jgi:hypothetical protein
MKVMKAVDPTLLEQELTAAEVFYRNISAWQTDVPGETDVVDHDEQGFPIEPVPEAEPVILAHDASKPKRTALFEEQEDAERLALINDRAQIDPAFAALSEITLRPR